MKVCAVVVTYGDRFHLLREVINAVLSEGVDKIILVDNGSVRNSRKGIEDLETRLKSKIKVTYLDQNEGSAFGFRTGLEEFYQSKDCDFAWILDDDNKVEEGSLSELISFWQSLKLNSSGFAENLTALCSFRKDRNVSRNVNHGIDHGYWTKRDNYFLGFHLFDLKTRMEIKLKNFFGFEKSKKKISNSEKKRMPYAPYGGFFLHKSLIDEIGYPDDKFYLYGDDREYTSRIRDKKGEIFLVPASIITDIDHTWEQVSRGFRGIVPVMLRIEDKNRLYYSVMNDSRRKMKSPENKFIYFLNKTLYLGYLFLMAIFFRRMEAFRTILRASRDGELLFKKNSTEIEKH